MERTALALLALIAVVALTLVLTSQAGRTDSHPCWDRAPGQTCPG